MEMLNLFDNGICFPEELMVDILSRVPANELVENRLVCKNWSLSMRDPHFVRCHLDVSLKSSETLIFWCGDDLDYYGADWLFSIKLFSVQNNHLSRIDLPVNLTSSWGTLFDFVGSVNGLLCIKSRDKGRTMFNVFNPCTSQIHTFPDNDYEYARGTAFYRFEHDPLENEYMVVVIYEVIGLATSNVCTYSLKTRRWSQMTTIPFTWNFFESTSCCIDEVLYIGTSFQSDHLASSICIIAINLHTKSWSQIKLPAYFSAQDNMIVSHGGGLGIIGYFKYPISNHDAVMYKCKDFPHSFDVWKIEAYKQDIPRGTTLLGLQGDEFLLERSNWQRNMNDDITFSLQIVSCNMYSGLEKVMIHQNSLFESWIIGSTNFVCSLVKF